MLRLTKRKSLLMEDVLSSHLPIAIEVFENVQGASGTLRLSTEYGWCARLEATSISPIFHRRHRFWEGLGEQNKARLVDRREYLEFVLHLHYKMGLTVMF